MWLYHITIRAFVFSLPHFCLLHIQLYLSCTFCVIIREGALLYTKTHSKLVFVVSKDLLPWCLVLHIMCFGRRVFRYKMIEVYSTELSFPHNVCKDCDDILKHFTMLTFLMTAWMPKMTHLYSLYVGKDFGINTKVLFRKSIYFKIVRLILKSQLFTTSIRILDNLEHEQHLTLYQR